MGKKPAIFSLCFCFLFLFTFGVGKDSITAFHGVLLCAGNIGMDGTRQGYRHHHFPGGFESSFFFEIVLEE
jgi:hypothetical protein